MTDTDSQQQTSTVTRNTPHGTLTVEVSRKPVDTDIDMVVDTHITVNVWVNGVPLQAHSHEHEVALKNCETTTKEAAELHADEIEPHMNGLSDYADEIHALVAEHDELSLAASSDGAHITVSETYLNYHTDSGVPENAHREADTDFRLKAYPGEGFTIYVEISETAAVTLAESLIHKLVREDSSLLSIVQAPQSPQFEGDAEGISSLTERIVDGQGGEAAVIDIEDAQAMLDPRTGEEMIPRELMDEAECAIDCYITDIRGHVGNTVILFSEFPSDDDIELARSFSDVNLEKRFNRGPESSLTMRDVWRAVTSFARNADLVEPLSEPPESDDFLIYKGIVGENTTVHSTRFSVRNGHISGDNDHLEFEHVGGDEWKVQAEHMNSEVVSEWNEWELVREDGEQLLLRMASVPVDFPLIKVRR